MADESFASAVFRAFALMRDGNADAAGSVMGGSVDKIDDLSDALIYQLYGFFEGYGSALAQFGEPAGQVVLNVIARGSAEDDPGKMRGVLKQLFSELSR